MSTSAARTISVSAARQQNSHLLDLEWPIKEPGDDLDYYLDVTAALADVAGDEIISASVAAEPAGNLGDIVLAKFAVTGSLISLWLDAGIPGCWYTVVIDVTTAANRQFQWPIGIQINPLDESGLGNALVWSPPTGLALDGIAIILQDPTGWPSSTQGLVSGNVWANGIFVNAVPSTMPNPSAPPVFFGSVSAAQLLALGAANLPLIDPLADNQLWLNGVQVCVSAGVGTGLALDGIALILQNSAGWHTSTVGIPTGGVWANGIFVNAVPGATPNPSAPPVFFGSITSVALLALGAGNLPLIDPHVNNQLWLNGVQVCVSAG